METLLKVNDLHVSFNTYQGEIQAVRGVTFEVKKGETVAIVGESGCGKSVTAQSLLRLLPTPPSRIKTGEILFRGQDLTRFTEKEMQQVRGSEVAMVFQDPMTSLNPTMTVGQQIVEGLRKHHQVSRTKAQEWAMDTLRMVGIPSPESRMKQYPHQFSGGMRQRVMIAIALSSSPKLLIADEPTTALDVTIQAQIMELMKELQERLGTAIILITHDLGVVAEIADRIVVMYAGKVVETGIVDDIFYRPRHPYTWGLLQSMPRLDLHKNRELTPIFGTPPELIDPPPGCPFVSRCKYAMQICQQEMPKMESPTSSHHVLCWLEHSMAPTVHFTRT